jgi:hypothetical protein
MGLVERSETIKLPEAEEPFRKMPKVGIFSKSDESRKDLSNEARE